MLRSTVKARKDLTFVVIYTREPHARQMGFKKIAQPIRWEERRDLARRTCKELGLKGMLVLIDEMGDPSRRLFGDIPNPAIFVEPDGKIRDKLSWADASEVGRVLGKWKPRPARKARPTETSPAGADPKPGANSKPGASPPRPGGKAPRRPKPSPVPPGRPQR